MDKYEINIASQWVLIKNPAKQTVINKIFPWKRTGSVLHDLAIVKYPKTKYTLFIGVKSYKLGSFPEMTAF